MKDAESLTFELTLTGYPALDYANTLDWRKSERPQETLNSYADLVAWSHHAGIVTKQDALRLLEEARRRPTAAERARGHAIELRENIYRIFSAVAEGREADPSDLDHLNRKLPEAMSRLKIGCREGGYAWEWADEKELDRIWWPVVRTAAELLTSADLEWLRECPGDGCAWLFIDQSRNKSRRWCSMKSCGNRAKARRHYELIKSDED